ncbi:CidA/LrgA family protein [Pseudomonas sp.]|uniref:CidA/LrgA family protein n=1 Tax=Pseudomonas sp. TaxID=306 RepID=UPI003CC644D7
MLTSSPQEPLVSPGDALRKTGMRWLQTIGQMLCLMLLWAVADRLATAWHLPVSGGILGLLILVALMAAGVVKAPMFERGAEVLLANMLLYFIPLVVSVVQYTQLFESEGLKLMVAIGVGFVSVLVVTALTVEWACAWTRKRQLQRLTQQRRSRPARALVLPAGEGRVR